MVQNLIFVPGLLLTILQMNKDSLLEHLRRHSATYASRNAVPLEIIALPDFP
jgi:hypothetical protein